MSPASISLAKAVQDIPYEWPLVRPLSTLPPVGRWFEVLGEAASSGGTGNHAAVGCDMRRKRTLSMRRTVDKHVGPLAQCRH